LSLKKQQHVTMMIVRVVVVKVSLLLLLLLLPLLLYHHHHHHHHHHDGKLHEDLAAAASSSSAVFVDAFALLFPSTTSRIMSRTSTPRRRRVTRCSAGHSSSSSSSSSSFSFSSYTKSSSQLQRGQRPAGGHAIILYKSPSDDSNENDDHSWDSDVDYENQDFSSSGRGQDSESPDPSVAWESSLADIPEIKAVDDLKNKLGINIGRMLEPLSEQQANELKAAATEVINDRVAAGLDDIATLRREMQTQMDETSREMQRQSQQQAQAATNSLLNKIDSMTTQFMMSTQSSRLSVKQAAAADRDSARARRGVELGSWGKLGGADVSVVASSSTISSSSSSGSTTFFEDPQEKEAKQQQQQTARRSPPKLLVVADVKQDDYAKLLIDPLTQQLSNVFASTAAAASDGSGSSSGGSIQVSVYAPTATLPLGGDHAAAVLLFLTSFSSASSVKNAMDRLLRKTLSTAGGAAGGVAMPPTQIVAISTVGTERTDTMPYSMQNMLGGGKLDQRRQMEEAVINVVNTRSMSPSLDYTICKLGDKLVREVKNNKGTEETFALKPGDVLDGPCHVDAAVQVLVQAIALQPAARNATLCAVGARSTRRPVVVVANSKDDDDDDEQAYWDDVFVPVMGPEVWRCEGLFNSRADDDIKNDETFLQLAEYIREWATLPSTSEKLTTPVQVVETPKMSTTTALSIGVEKQAAIQFLYLPTATGSSYMSKEEERAREKESPFSKSSSSSSSSNAASNIPRVQARKLGGLEILIEQHCGSRTTGTKEKAMSLRIRARRCNYAPGAVLKEITETSLIARLRKSVDVWKNNHAESSSR
jgi:hypothetical protein